MADTTEAELAWYRVQPRTLSDACYIYCRKAKRTSKYVIFANSSLTSIYGPISQYQARCRWEKPTTVVAPELQKRLERLAKSFNY